MTYRPGPDSVDIPQMEETFRFQITTPSPLSVQASMRKIVITGQSPLQILDVTGPLEVFSNVADYEVVLGSADGGDALRTNRHVSLTPAVPLADLCVPI